MSGDAIEERKNLQESVKASLRKAEMIVSALRKNNTILLSTTILSSAAATLVAGITAVIGPVASIGTEGWRIACVIAAIFGFVSTVSTGLSQQLKISDRLSDGRQGLGKLRYLDAVITTGSMSWEEVTKEYEGIAKAYPELIN